MEAQCVSVSNASLEEQQPGVPGRNLDAFRCLWSPWLRGDTDLMSSQLTAEAQPKLI